MLTDESMRYVLEWYRHQRIKNVLSIGLQSEQVLAAEWEKSAVQELDITATDLPGDCIVELLTRIPNIRWLSAGQMDGLTDSVTHTFYICLSNKHHR